MKLENETLSSSLLGEDGTTEDEDVSSDEVTDEL